MEKLERTIKVKNSFVGFHRYEQAPEDVQFLRNWHRHNFIVYTTISVNNDDRDIEFFELQNEVNHFVRLDYDLRNCREAEKWLGDIVIDSCESLAESIVDYFQFNYPERSYISVEVSEDGECSATVSWRKD